MPKKILIPEINIRTQKQTQWCYAAVIQMILEYYGSITTQEAIVEAITGDDTNNDPQDPTLYLMKTLDYIDNDEPCGCSGSRVLKFDKIKKEIDRHRPIIVKLTGGTGHYVLIVGYDMNIPDGITQVFYIDPNKRHHNIENVSIVTGITTVNTIYQDALTRENLNGPSAIGGFCFTHPPGERSFPVKGSAAKGTKGNTKGSPNGSPKGKSKGGSFRGGMKSKKYRKSRSTRKKIRGKSRRVRK